MEHRNPKLLIFIVSLLVSTLAFGQARPFFPVTVHSFGAIHEDDGKAECTFTIINAGTSPLSILSVRATCGCTTPSYPRHAIAPGDSALISVAYDPAGRPGRFSKAVEVVTNGVPSKTKLEVAGTVIAGEATIGRRYPVDMGPLKIAKAVYPLGDAIMGRFKTVYLEGYNRSDDSLRIAVANVPAYLDVAVAPEIAAPGEQVTFIAYVAPRNDTQYGIVEDTVTIMPAPGLEYRLPTLVNIVEDFSDVSPAALAKAPIVVTSVDRLELGKVSRDKPITASIRLENAGKSDLIVRRVYSVDPGVKTTVKSDRIKKGKSTDVSIEIDPTAVAGALLNTRLQIITNDPLRPLITVRVVGEWE